MTRRNSVAVADRSAIRLVNPYLATTGVTGKLLGDFLRFLLCIRSRGRTISSFFYNLPNIGPLGVRDVVISHTF